MAIDMSQFFQIFFEESEEHLATMESLLLELDVAQPDPEQLNAIFRAAHSIMGSAGTFGFADLAETTHVLENVLDRIRKGQRKISGVNFLLINTDANMRIKAQLTPKRFDSDVILIMSKQCFDQCRFARAIAAA